MTPQSTFMIVAPIRQNSVGAMRELLTSMNSGHGIADPENTLVPFGRFADLHFARFVVLDDLTIGDPAEFYGVVRPDPPIYLAFLGDFDGSYDSFINLLVETAAPGLRRIFSLCEGFSSDMDLRSWVVAHEVRPTAYYCNWVGRTVRQTIEEERLRIALRSYLDGSPAIADSPAAMVHQSLHRFMQGEVKAGRLTLTPPDPTPLGYTVRTILDWVILFVAVLGAIVTLPITIIPLALLAWMLRSRENSDPEFAPLPDPATGDEPGRPGRLRRY